MPRSPRASLLRHVLLRARRTAATLSHAVRERVHPPDDRIPLERLQRRLEIVLAATYNRAIPVSAIPDERPARGIRRAVATLREMRRVPTATTDGTTVMLPPMLPREVPHDETIIRYRLLAIEQAERIVRGTPAFTPEDDALARDLYLLREAQQVDGAIASANAGLAPALDRARRDALVTRPSLDGLSPIERAVEGLVREALGAGTPPAHGVRGEAPAAPSSPAASAQWAADTAALLRRLPGPYRGVPPVGLWGVHRAARAAASIDASDARQANAGGANAVPLPVGDVATASDKPPEENARLGVTSDSHDPPPDIDPDTMPDLPASPDGKGDHDALMHAAGESIDPDAPGISYPEWDASAQRYVPDGVTVRLSDADEADEAWAASMLAARASLLRRVQQQFERLRARRLRLNAQRRGDDLDLAACVRAIVDRRAGLSPDERLYTDTRPARRGLAITLLVDVSGSTDTQVTHALQVIDIEKIALLLATTAFDALGDPYNVLTFTGRSAADVRIATVKSFAERSGLTVRRRISALRPEGGTRLGAAVRHAVALLQRQPAGHRLLLILSDGRPNDVGYMDTYAVEDSRQSVLEARAAGVFPFCLTVDRDGAEYLPHVFGPTGHVVIRNPEQLPSALLRAVRQLLRFS